MMSCLCCTSLIFHMQAQKRGQAAPIRLWQRDVCVHILAGHRFFVSEDSRQWCRYPLLIRYLLAIPLHDMLSLLVYGGKPLFLHSHSMGARPHLLSTLGQWLYRSVNTINQHLFTTQTFLFDGFTTSILSLQEWMGMHAVPR